MLLSLKVLVLPSTPLSPKVLHLPSKPLVLLLPSKPIVSKPY